MLYVIAAGAKIDPDKVEKFSVQLDKVYGNPFVRQKREPRTAAEIKEYLICRLEGKEWT